MSQSPVFSIVIPTYQRPEQLFSCLASLCELQYDREFFEVVIVQDGGGSVQETVSRFESRLSLQLICQDNCGPASARNRGAHFARGKFLAFTDDDCAPHPRWLQSLEEVLKTDETCAVGGKTINALKDNACAETSQMILDVVYEFYNRNPSNTRFFASNNLACSADAFRSLGAFNGAYRTSEDREFCDRWLRSGRKLVYAPEAVVLHSHKLNVSSLWKQHFHYGKGAFQYHAGRKKLGLQGLQIESGFYKRLFLAPFRKEGAHSRAKLLALLFVSQMANAFGYFSQLNHRDTESQRSEEKMKFSDESM